MSLRRFDGSNFNFWKEQMQDYLIGTEVIIETDCLPILGMVSGCTSPDLAMLAGLMIREGEFRDVTGSG